MQRKLQYQHNRQGDIVKIEIKDFTRAVIYRNKFNIRDKNAMINFLKVLENYSEISMYDLIREKMGVGEWW